MRGRPGGACFREPPQGEDDGRVPIERRAFLGTLAASAAALVVRAALLPRPLDEDEIARLAETPPLVPAVVPPVPAAAVSEADVDLAGSMGRLNPLAQNLELVPHVTRFRPNFKINTVERQPQKGLFTREAWSIGVDGLVERPFELTPTTLAELPRAAQVADFHCVEGWGIRDVQWEGVRLATVLARAGIGSNARFVTFQTLGGVYSDSLTLEQALREETLLATTIDGGPLPDRQGFPVRLVVPFMYGYKSVKWVARITLEPRRHVGFWQRRGWQLDPYV